MLEMLIKQIMPPDFDMGAAMDAIKAVGQRIIATDDRTAAMAEAQKQDRDTLQRIETTQARILALLEGKDNGRPD